MLPRAITSHKDFNSFSLVDCTHGDSDAMQGAENGKALLVEGTPESWVGLLEMLPSALDMPYGQFPNQGNNYPISGIPNQVCQWFPVTTVTSQCQIYSSLWHCSICNASFQSSTMQCHWGYIPALHSKNREVGWLEVGHAQPSPLPSRTGQGERRAAAHRASVFPQSRLGEGGGCTL